MARVLGDYQQLLEIVEGKHIDKIIITVPNRHSGGALTEALLACKMRGIEIEETGTFYEKMYGKIMLELLQPCSLIFSRTYSISPLLRLVKRLSDIGLATMFLVLAAPLMTVLAALIRIDSRGPALFSQERVGKNGQPFILFKFRSMYIDAEAETGPVFATESDNRITRVGRLLRRTRLDELPQFLNVLKGDMSFIGPRPERAFFVEQFEKEIPYFSQRLIVKPGITGWAQVNYPYGDSLEDAKEKLRFDLYYIKHMSLFLDLLILLKTAKIAICARGR